MLYLDVEKACLNKGIENTKRWLLDCGLSRPAAYRLYNRTQDSVNLKVLERMCMRLNCTPNDFLSWQPDNDNNVPETHPMQKLKPVAKGHTINARLKSLSPDKLEALQQFLDKLSDE